VDSYQTLSTTDGGPHAAPGVSLREFVRLKEVALRLQARKGKWRRTWTGKMRPAGEPLSTTDLCHEYIMPQTLERRCSYHQALPASAKPPATAYVSHAWQLIFADVVDALVRELGEDASVWFCLFMNNQHQAHEAPLPFEVLERTFRANLEAIGRVVLLLTPAQGPVLLTRSRSL
jgi:hypothetical protein